MSKTIQHSPDMRLKLANAYVMQIRNERKKSYAAAFLGFKQGLLEHEPERKDYKLSYMAAQAVRIQLHMIYEGVTKL